MTDVKVMVRITVLLYDIPIAMNESTADFLLNSSFMGEDYIRETEEHK